MQDREHASFPNHYEKFMDSGMSRMCAACPRAVQNEIGDLFRGFQLRREIHF